jgi:ABC-2 type transport system ATP-binding protein
MLIASSLRKEFASVVAVDGVSFTVRRGEIFGLLGPNGAGKSTTIRMVLNILQPDAGTITYDGQAFNPLTRNSIGYLPEERGLYRKSKLLDTILYLAELRGMDRGRAKADSLVWLKRVGLLEYCDRRVEELSKGNQQKIQFITSIIHDPALVVLDEPFSGLDPVNQLLFKDIFLQLKKAGKAVIFSTHQMDQAERLSDTLCLINRGKAVLAGTIREVKAKYGSNNIHIEFVGDGSFLQSLPGISRALLYRNTAELGLADGVSPQQILPMILEKVDLRKFEVVEPSLYSIFLQIVGGVETAQTETMQ